MNDDSQEPSGGSLWLTVIAVVGCFLLFVGVLYIAYFPTRPATDVMTPVFSAAELKEIDKLPPAERAAKLTELRWQRRVPTPQERKDKLVELREKEAVALTGYSWVDQEQGIVRLPIERAIELTLQDLQTGRSGR
jgi:hypothetical protein